MYEDLRVYRGSTFDCSISLVDRNRNTFLLSEGDKLIFGVKASLKVDSETNKEAEDIIRKELTADDEIAGKYYFSLDPDETALSEEQYFYYVSIELSDGDRYQIAPYSCFNVGLPVVLSYDRGHEICCQVPRIMRRKSCKSTKQQILDYIKSVYDEKNIVWVRIRNFGKIDIMMVNNSLAHHCISSDKLLNILAKKCDCFDSENYIIIGFNHTMGPSKDDRQAEYNGAIRELFKEHFFDLEGYMKEPVYSENQDLISCKALQIAGINPTEEDLQRIALSEYPDCIMYDDTHFNDTGYNIIAEILLKEVENNVF